MDQAFEVHMLNEDGKVKARDIASKFDALLADIVDMCGEHSNGSARSLAIMRTKLEEACMFAKKAVALSPVNQIQNADKLTE
jgi:hypothetical protein